MSRWKWNLEAEAFEERGKPEKKRSKARTNNCDFNPQETASKEIEPGSQRWEATLYPLRHLCSLV